MDNENQFDFLQAILKQTKFDDPAIKYLIEKKFKNSYKKGEQKEISNEIIRRLRIQNKKLLEQVASLREQLKNSRIDRSQAMEKQNYLMKLNTSLADALGSCNSCWGEDPQCTICSGEGYPGWRKINKRLFNLYVLPSLEKIVSVGEHIRSG